MGGTAVTQNPEKPGFKGRNIFQLAYFSEGCKHRLAYTVLRHGTAARIVKGKAVHISAVKFIEVTEGGGVPSF